MPANFGALALVFWTVLSALYANSRDSRALFGLAALGGFSTPLLLERGAGEGSVLPFLAYWLGLSAGLMSVAMFKNWHEWRLGIFAASAALFGFWASQIGVPNSENGAWISVFLVLGGAVFGVAATWETLRRGAKFHDLDAILPATNFVLLQLALGEWSRIEPRVSMAVLAAVSLTLWATYAKLGQRDARFSSILAGLFAWFLLGLATSISTWTLPMNLAALSLFFTTFSRLGRERIWRFAAISALSLS